MSSTPDRQHPVFCAVADNAYFVGAVALVNSLRLTGHVGEIAFLDVGLTESQRAFLEREATIHEGPPDVGWLSVFVKPTLGLLYPEHVVVMLDNDIVVTAPLEPLVRAAQSGEIAVVEDTDPTRCFPEWETIFSLRAPVQHGTYAIGACVALSTGIWRDFLERWLELGKSIAEMRAGRAFLLTQQEAVGDPVAYNEQDALNALLMSEVPRSAVRVWPQDRTPHWWKRDDVRIVDPKSLRCTIHGEETLFLHCSGQPKPWQPRGWLRRRYRAFNRLLTRVLVEPDVPLRLPTEEIPPWLREGVRGRLAGTSGAAVAWAAHQSTAILPEDFRARITAPIRNRVSGTHARA